ncbi:hypothetical protein ASD45_08395 [Pseudolabrys sp. Root1462]|uniref:hypothetical protein n=1 Tax=Pseudolabrys sp. Root1462 TaxID=1736466 RepID=UPI0007035DE2|nr:hypothetical protein [Pseudolabrys sp. Root1462]KQZ00872.1 hypothetical protein ASD45_08395 [Pseudolabrys sp. Root1462]
MAEPLKALQDWRKREGVSFDDLVAKLRQRGIETTKATLSRAEAGKHPLDVKVATHLRALTGLSGTDLRPDLADLMQVEVST